MPSSDDGDGSVPSVPGQDRPSSAWLLGWGLLVWAAVAVSIRLVGNVLLDPSRPTVVFGFFVAVVPLMALVTYPVYWRLGIARSARPAAAALMSLPGLFLDVFLIGFASVAFPAMDHVAVVHFAAILLFGYGIVLATGFFPRRPAG